MTFDERDLYTGLAALHWATISKTDSRWDQAFYEQIIRQNNGRALELGCGAGRLLLAYLQAGLDVEEADISSEMLAVCRQQALAAGLNPILYEQRDAAVGDTPPLSDDLYSLWQFCLCDGSYLGVDHAPTLLCASRTGRHASL